MAPRWPCQTKVPVRTYSVRNSYVFSKLPSIFFSFAVCPLSTVSASPAGLHLQDLILDTKATASKEQKAEAVSLWSGGHAGRVQFSIAYACVLFVFGHWQIYSHDDEPSFFTRLFPAKPFAAETPPCCCQEPGRSHKEPGSKVSLAAPQQQKGGGEAAAMSERNRLHEGHWL